MCVSCLAILYLEAFITTFSGALTLAILVRVLQSWVPLRLPLGLGELVWSVSEPLLAPIRRALPATGGIDFSPFIAILAIQAGTAILLRLLPPVV